MKAILCRAWGGPEDLRFEEVAPPLLGPHQVRIRVRACGINFADTLVIAGKYQVKPPFPFSPGIEVAGDIVETGAEVSRLRPGQRVCAFLRACGGYAEEVAADAAATIAIPDAMDHVTAAGFPVAYGTSHLALTHRGKLRAGETLLVLGAAGGVGLTAVEIGKALGARVIAAAGGPDKLAVAKEHGADELIDYAKESIRDRVRELTGGRGADVVYDPVGGDAFDQALRAVNWEMAGEFWLDDRQWAAIEPLLPKNQPGAHRKDDRRIISGIVHVLKAGCRWQDCPAVYGPPTTIYNRFHRWARRGIWRQLFAALATTDPGGIQMIDSTTAKARRPAEKGGRCPSDRPLSWRANDKNPCCCRWLRPPRRA